MLSVSYENVTKEASTTLKTASVFSPLSCKTLLVSSVVFVANVEQVIVELTALISPSAVISTRFSAFPFVVAELFV